MSRASAWQSFFGVYLEGPGDLRSGFMRMIGITMWIIGVINLLTKSP